MRTTCQGSVTHAATVTPGLGQLANARLNATGTGVICDLINVPDWLAAAMFYHGGMEIHQAIQASGLI